MVTTLQPNQISYLASLPNSELIRIVSNLIRDVGEEQTYSICKQISSHRNTYEVSIDPGDAKLKRDRERQERITRAKQDIGPIPICEDPARRERCRWSIKEHAKTYHSDIFNLPFAKYHDKLYSVAEDVVFNGGWFVFAVPRAGGKSKSVEVICEWAVFHGHKVFPILIGATQPKAIKRLKNLKIQFRQNKLLLDDFPEIVFPISCLGRSARKAEGQRCMGYSTAIEWLTEQIALPTLSQQTWQRWIDESQYERKAGALPEQTFGHRIAAAGLTGDIRGISEVTEDLKNIRPDLAIPDDPQTRESARSHQQSYFRAQILTGDVAYLNGPDTAMSILMPATVIYRGDMVDQMLDRETYPEWHGERHAMIEEWPTNMDLWDRYSEIYKDCLRNDRPVDRANKFYEENREAMDEGCVVSWPERHNDNELSGIQAAMNLFYRNREAFMAEAQNDPTADQEDNVTVATADAIVEKVSHVEKDVVPKWATTLVAFFDVQEDLLFYGVGAFSEVFEGSVIRYGAVPDQERNYFTKSESLKGLSSVFRIEDGFTRPEQRIYAALMAAIDRLAETKFKREDGIELQIKRINIDYGFKSEVVNQVCRESKHAGLLYPTKGFGIGAKKTPMADRKRKEGEIKGNYWSIRPLPDLTGMYCNVDSNYWKTQVHLAFCAAAGGAGSLSLYKARPEQHRMIADHCNAEKGILVKVDDNEVVEWTEKPTRPDNDFFDVVYNLMAAASMEGCRLPNAHDETIQDTPRADRKVWGSSDFI